MSAKPTGSTKRGRPVTLGASERQRRKKEYAKQKRARSIDLGVVHEKWEHFRKLHSWTNQEMASLLIDSYEAFQQHKVLCVNATQPWISKPTTVEPVPCSENEFTIKNVCETPSNEEQPSEKLFIGGYQVFFNPDSANPSKPADNSPERDPDDLPVTFDVKTEPVDPDYESSTSPASTSSPATMPIMTLPPPRQRRQLKDVLPRLKQMQQMNDSSAPANVIDQLLKKKELLMAKHNTDDDKPSSCNSKNLDDIKRSDNLMEANQHSFISNIAG